MLSPAAPGGPDGVARRAADGDDADEAMQQLRARRANFRGMRSLMRVRATTNGKTQSFRAQLAVHDARRMELIAYTPVGTTALKMKADGDRITTDPEKGRAGVVDFLRARRGHAGGATRTLLLGLPSSHDVREGSDGRWVRDENGGIQRLSTTRTSRSTQ